MFLLFEALSALEEYGTMSKAASQLGISQPAISKRIKQLEQELGRTLIQPSGRKVVLSPYAQNLLERAKPLYLDFKTALKVEVSEGTGDLVVALSGALLLSWGAKVLAKIRKDNPEIRFKYGVYRSPVAIGQVRSGDCMLAIVHGMGELTPDLSSKLLTDDEFVIVPSELKPMKLPRRGKKLSLLTIEAHSETWSVLERRLNRWSLRSGVELKVSNSLQNFAGVASLAQAGYGNGLVPIGVTKALGLPKNKLLYFPRPGLKIPISIVGRPSMLERSLVKQFFNSIKLHIAEGQGSLPKF